MKVLLLSSLLILTVACNGGGNSDSKKGQEQDSYTDRNADDSQPKMTGVYMDDCQLEDGEQGEDENDTWLRTQLVISKEHKITMTKFFYSDDECKRQQFKDSIAFINPRRQGDGSLTATYKDPEVGMVKGKFSVDADEARAELCLEDECLNFDLYRVK